MNVMTIEYAQIISTLDQRPESIEPTPVFMDQADEISCLENFKSALLDFDTSLNQDCFFVDILLNNFF